MSGLGQRFSFRKELVTPTQRGVGHRPTLLRLGTAQCDGSAKNNRAAAAMAERPERDTSCRLRPAGILYGSEWSITGDATPAYRQSLPIARLHKGLAGALP
jgi:hypothetical protein